MDKLIIPAHSKHSPQAAKIAQAVINGAKLFDVIGKMYPKGDVDASLMNDVIRLLLNHARLSAIAFGRKHAELHKRPAYPLGESDLQVVKDKYKDLCAKYSVNPNHILPRYEVVTVDGGTVNFKFQVRDTKTGSLVVYKGNRKDTQLLNGGTVWSLYSDAYHYAQRLNTEDREARKKELADD
jgi:hypothetical protein